MTVADPRVCDKCGESKPLHQYKKWGRGWLTACRECTEATPGLSENQEIIALLKQANALMSEQIGLMQGHRCNRCGAMGAENGNPPLCYGCKS